MTLWTHYWTGKTVAREERYTQHTGDDLMEHTAGNQFLGRGVGPGDTVYIITYSDGDLRIIGKMVVDAVLNQHDAEVRMGTTNLWKASEHLVARPGTASKRCFNAVVPQSQLNNLKFVTDSGLRGIVYNRHGLPDQQTFRAVRKINAPTARLFDTLLGIRPQTAKNMATTDSKRPASAKSGIRKQLPATTSIRKTK